MNKYVIKRMINLILICLLTLETFLMFFHNGFVKADSFRYEYNSNNLDYPGYKERIDAIKANHPKWKFIIMDTTNINILGGLNRMRRSMIAVGMITRISDRMRAEYTAEHCQC